MCSILNNNEVTVNSLLMKSLESATREYARKCVSSLALEYGFSESEALKKLNLENLKLQVQEMKKRSGGKAKAKEAKTEKPEKSKKALFALPFSRSNVSETGCQGLAYNGGLFTQCPKSCMESLNYCKGCQSEIDKNGRTTNGTVAERLACDLMEFKDPKGRKPVAYVKIMEKQKVSREQVEAEASKLNIMIDEMHFVAVEKKEKKEKKKVEKEEDDLLVQLLEDLGIEEEVDLEEVNLEEDSKKQDEEKALKQQQDEEKALKKQQQDEEKALKKQQQDEEKALKKQQQDEEKALKKQQQDEEKAVKAAKDAEVALKKQQLADEKAAKEAEVALKKQQLADEKAAKEAEVALKKQQLADEKAAKAQQIADEKAAKAQQIADEKAAKAQQIADEKAAKAQQIADEKAAKEKKIADEKALKKQQEEEEKAAKKEEGIKKLKEHQKKATTPEKKQKEAEPVVEAPAPKKVTVKRITIEGKQYLKTADNLLYDPETKEEMGIYDPATNTIKSLPDDSEDELSEDDMSDSE
jgi:hypothetical protein